MPILLRRLVLLLKNLKARSMAQYVQPVPYKKPSLNDLPCPKGSFQAAYDAKQMNYNMILLGSVAFFIGSVYIGVPMVPLLFYTGPPWNEASMVPIEPIDEIFELDFVASKAPEVRI